MRQQLLKHLTARDCKAGLESQHLGSPAQKACDQSGISLARMYISTGATEATKPAKLIMAVPNPYQSGKCCPRRPELIARDSNVKIDI